MRRMTRVVDYPAGRGIALATIAILFTFDGSAKSDRRAALESHAVSATYIDNF